MTMPKALLRSAFVLLLAFAASCDQLTDTTVRVGGLEIVEGNDITAAVGTEVTASARVVDAGGSPIEGIDVTLDVVSGGGSVTPGTTTSGSDGTISGTWTLGTTPGTQRLRVGAGAFQLTFSVTAEPGPLATLDATPDSVRFTALQQTRTLSASGADAYGNAVEPTGLSWATNSTGIAQVDGTGVVTAVGPGMATVSVSSGSISADVKVVVEQVVSDVAVSPDGASLAALGDTAHLTATAADANGFEVAGASATWSTTDASVATVDGQGVVTAVAAGTARIGAMMAGAADTVVISVSPVVTTVVLTPDSVELTALGATRTLTASPLDANGNAVAGASITWSSLNTAVATVTTAGVVTSVAEGTAWIRAGASTVSGSIHDSTKVVVAPVVDSLAITADSLHFAAIGDTLIAEARGYDANSNDLGPQMVTWSTTNVGVATVDADGNVVSTGNGGAQLVAALGALEDTAAIGVRQEVFSVAVTPALDTLWAIGDTVRLNAALADSNGVAVTDTTPTWTSSDTLVATVDAAGLVTAVAPGTALVEAAVGAVADTGTIVVAAGADSVAVTPDSINFSALGDTIPLVAAAFDSLGGSVDAQFTWASLDAAIATVDTAGNVIAVAAGTTYVHASAPAVAGGTVADTSKVVVAPVPAALAVIPDTVYLPSLGDTSTVTAHVFDTNGNDLGPAAVTWGSTNGAVATVDASGNVVSVANGSARVAATLASPSLTDTIGVGVYQEVASMAITPTTDTLAMGDTTQLTLSVYDARGVALARSYSTAWASDDAATASVGTLGLVTGEMVGVTNVTATVEGSAAAAPIAVAPHPNRAISVSYYAACALDREGTAYCWGNDDWGQIGDNDGTADFASMAEPVSGGHTFFQLTGNGYVTCGLDTAGQAWCWGDNSHGNTGNGNEDGLVYDAPQMVVGGHVFTQIDAQWDNVCAVDDAGAAWCWGRGTENQLGDGLGTDSGTPVAVSGGLTYAEVAVGRYFACGLTTVGQVYCWGSNSNYQFGDGTLNSSTTPTLAANGETFDNISLDWWGGCGVKSDNTAMCWGYNGNGRVGDGTTTTATVPVAVTGAYNWLTLSPSNGWTCGLTTTGAITCVGAGGSGRTGTGNFDDVAVHTPISTGETFVAVDAELVGACGLADSGNIQCWGAAQVAGSYPYTVTPDAVGLTGTVEVTAAGAFTCARDNIGDVRCWGTNSSGELGDGTTTHTDSPVQVSGGIAFSRVAPGWYHTCSIGAADSLAYCWGDNGRGRLGNGTVFGNSTTPTVTSGGNKFVDISSGQDFTCGLTEFGEALCWGGNDYYQTSDVLGDSVTTPTLAADSPFVVITAGDFHACGLTAGGTAFCWGLNAYGELGATSADDCSGDPCSATPLKVSGGLTFDTLSAGRYHTCGITTVGETYCWGLNNLGQLGDGSFTNSQTPVVVPAGVAFTTIAAAGYNTCGIDGVNGLYCWGSNVNHQLGDGTTTSRSTAELISGLAATSVEGSGGHICASTTSGDAYCWGFRNYGQTADGMAYLHTPTYVGHSMSPFVQLSSLVFVPGMYLDPLSGFMPAFGAGVGEPEPGTRGGDSPKGTEVQQQ